MKSLADRLNLRSTSSSTGGELNVIFGSVGNLAQTISVSEPPVRIGLWPLISQTNPETAIGVMAVLGYLLEQWQGIRIYYLFTRLAEGDNPESYTWEISKSQFSPDDWVIDDLGENAAIFGTCEHSARGWTLELDVENDLAVAPNDSKHFSLEEQNLTGLLSALRESVVPAIATFLGLEKQQRAASSDSELLSHEDDTARLMQKLFKWELNLFLSAWGKDWSQTCIDEYKNLLSTGKSADGFGAWICLNALRRGLMPRLSDVQEVLASQIEDTRNTFSSHKQRLALSLSEVYFSLGMLAEAYAELSKYLENSPQDTSAWKSVISLYLRSGRIADCVQAYQSAIDADAADDALYVAYADLLVVLDYEKWQVDRLMFVDDGVHDNRLVQEAVEAYQAALELNASNIEALHNQTIQYIELRDIEQVTSNLEKLVAMDSTKEHVRSIVDQLYNFDDLSPFIKLLETATITEPNLASNHVNLAIVYLENSDHDKALKALETADELTDNALILADIERLRLSGNNPDFESQLGDIIDRVSAGNLLDDEDAEFLEAAVSDAPMFAEGYLLLAQVYTSWEDDSAALEVLLDGQKHLPDDADIIEQLARLLWKSDEKELALDYLNKGLKTNGQSVNLLALTGWYLFQEGEEEQAKLFLSRAESLNPRNPTFKEVREAIVRLINDDL